MPEESGSREKRSVTTPWVEEGLKNRTNRTVTKQSRKGFIDSGESTGERVPSKHKGGAERNSVQCNPVERAQSLRDGRG